MKDQLYDDTVFTPGSIQSAQEGCTCDPYVNLQGRGHASGRKDTLGRPVFSVARDCPMHDRDQPGSITASDTETFTAVDIP